MQIKKSLILIILVILFSQDRAEAQENSLSHYFISASLSNPAHAGDTRYSQFQMAERIQPTASNELIRNTLISYDQKLPNHRSGFGIYFNEKSAKINEYNARLNYSYSLKLFKKYWLKAGLGISFHGLNTHASSYTYPEQYNDYGLTGEPHHEAIPSEKAYYAGFSAGFAIYDDFSWITVSVDNINRPGIEIIGEKYHAPLIINAAWGMVIPINKNQRPRRLLGANGGLIPYSSIGPIVSFYKNGPFHIITWGVSAFTKPVFWGVNLRYHTVYDDYFGEGTASLNFLAGYRTESFSIAYSYDYMLNRTLTNYKGAHEVSLIYYLFSVKEDYKKNKLFPFVNQLMY